MSRQSLKRSQSLREASDARLKVGLASKLDVFRAELQAVADPGRAGALGGGARVGAGAASASSSALPPADPVEPEAAGPARDARPELEPLEVLVARALENRLELQEARDQVEDARRTASLAKQNLLPQLDLNLGLTQSRRRPAFGDASSAARHARQPVRSARPIPSSARATRPERRSPSSTSPPRERTLRQRELDVEAEVRTRRARAGAHPQERRAPEARRSTFAEQQRRLATLRYQRGLASNFDVVDAEGSLVVARSALVGLLTSYQVARSSSCAPTGTLDVDKEFAP